MAYLKLGKYEYRIISNPISLSDISNIVDQFNPADKISLVIHHKDNNYSDSKCGIKRSILVRTDKNITLTNIVLHMINDDNKVEVTVPLYRDRVTREIVWSQYL